MSAGLRGAAGFGELLPIIFVWGLLATAVAIQLWFNSKHVILAVFLFLFEIGLDAALGLLAMIVTVFVLWQGFRRNQGGQQLGTRGRQV